MEWFDYYDIAERFIELINPTTNAKMMQLAEILGLKPNQQVIDFGCGYAEMLTLWAQKHGIKGIGIDIRSNACKRAEKKIIDNNIQESIKVVCGNAKEYTFEPYKYDFACCIGATFIWGGWGETIEGMRKAIVPHGKLVIGELHWQNEYIPAPIFRNTPGTLTELELWQMAMDKGYEIEYLLRSSQEEWDNYNASNWRGLIHWIQENSSHPERDQVVKFLHTEQEEYFRYTKDNFGWAIYVLTPNK